MTAQEGKGPECFSLRHPSARENGFSATPFSDCLIFYSEWSHRNSHSFEVAIITADIAASTATVLQTNRSPKEQSLKMRKQPKGQKKIGFEVGGEEKQTKQSKTKPLNVICTSSAIKARRRRRETGTLLWRVMCDNSITRVTKWLVKCKLVCRSQRTSFIAKLVVYKRLLQWFQAQCSRPSVTVCRFLLMKSHCLAFHPLVFKGSSAGATSVLNDVSLFF